MALFPSMDAAAGTEAGVDFFDLHTRRIFDQQIFHRNLSFYLRTVTFFENYCFFLYSSSIGCRKATVFFYIVAFCWRESAFCRIRL